MICPFCKSVGFVPSDEFEYPIRNLGKKEHYDTVDFRRYQCLVCGKVFQTKEVFYREIIVRTGTKQQKVAP